MTVKHYHNINDFLKDIGIPMLKSKGFYIAKFEDYDDDQIIGNSEITYAHNYFEISFSMGYDANVSINENTTNALDYNLSFVSPGQIVTWELNDVQPETMSYIMLFKPEFLPIAIDVFNIYENFPYFNNNTISSFQLNDKQIKKFINLFKKIKKEYNSNLDGNFEVIKAYLSIFLIKAKRELEFSKGVSYLKSRSQEITYNFENIIKKTKHKHKPIKYYAEKLNISTIYLSECIKKTTGKTAKQVINEYLVLEAKSMLKQSTNSIAEIGFLLGFDDNSNFVKYFRKQTNLTPRQYKNLSNKT